MERHTFKRQRPAGRQDKLGRRIMQNNEALKSDPSGVLAAIRISNLCYMFRNHPEELVNANKRKDENDGKESEVNQ